MVRSPAQSLHFLFQICEKMAAPGSEGDMAGDNDMEWEDQDGDTGEVGGAVIAGSSAAEEKEEGGKPQEAVAGAGEDCPSAADERKGEGEGKGGDPAAEDGENRDGSTSEVKKGDAGEMTEEGREDEEEKEQQQPATEQGHQQTLPPSHSQPPAEDPDISANEEEEEDERKDTPQEPPQRTSENSSSESSDEDRGCGRGWWSSRGQSRKLQLPRKPSQWSSRDTARYRDGYPGKGDRRDLNDNYLFYTNWIPSRPNGDYIDHIHIHWRGDYDRLEWNHSYIQWLFPIRERGMNWEAQELQPHEIKAILEDKAPDEKVTDEKAPDEKAPDEKATDETAPDEKATDEKATDEKAPDETALDRVMKSYEMMLDFYGMKIKSKETGELARTPNYKDRFQNLNHSSHNYLRITRILKCLGEFGLEYLKVPFIEFVLHEAIETQMLRNTLDSCMCYWVEVLRNDEERERLWELAGEMVEKANKEGKKKGNKKEGKKGGKKKDEKKKDGKKEEGKEEGKEEEGAKDGKKEEGKEEEGAKDGKMEEGKKDGKEGEEEEEEGKDGKEGKEEDSGASRDPQSQSNGREC